MNLSGKAGAKVKTATGPDAPPPTSVYETPPSPLPSPKGSQDISDAGIVALLNLGQRAARLVGAYPQNVLGDGPEVSIRSAAQVAFWAKALLFAGMRLENEAKRLTEEETQ